MERYEESSDKTKCDKGISWMKSCRECLFQVLCKFNSFYQKQWQQITQKEHHAKSSQEWCDTWDL